LLQPGDQLLQVLRRQRLFADEPHRTIGDQRNRREIAHHVERQIESRAIDDMGLPMAEDQCVAVRRRARDLGGANGAGRAGRIFDDDILAECALHTVSEDAAERIGRPAGRERHDDRDRPRRIGLGGCGRDTYDEKTKGNGQESFHATSSLASKAPQSIA
jgi:hypothetical protein